MADFNVLVAKKFRSEEPLTIQTGDIVGVFPTTHKFSEQELCQFLVVPITGVTEQEVFRLSIPQYQNGEDTLDLSGDLKKASVMVAKRKYSIKLADISTLAAAAGKTIDQAKLIDPTINYQPIIDAKIKITVKLVNCITNKHTNAYLRDFT